LLLPLLLLAVLEYLGQSLFVAIRFRQTVYQIHLARPELLLQRILADDFDQLLQHEQEQRIVLSVVCEVGDVAQLQQSRFAYGLGQDTCNEGRDPGIQRLPLIHLVDQLLENLDHDVRLDIGLLAQCLQESYDAFQINIVYTIQNIHQQIEAHILKGLLWQLKLEESIHKRGKAIWSGHRSSAIFFCLRIFCCRSLCFCCLDLNIILHLFICILLFIVEVILKVLTGLLGQFLLVGALVLLLLLGRAISSYRGAWSLPGTTVLGLILAVVRALSGRLALGLLAQLFRSRSKVWR